MVSASEFKESMRNLHEYSREIGYSTRSFLTFLIDKKYDLPASPSQIVKFMKDYNLHDESNLYINPWMRNPYKNEASCKRTILHFHQPRGFACWYGKDTKKGCTNRNCKYHPNSQAPDKIATPCNLDRGVIWKKNTPDSTLSWGSNYIEVLKKEILGEHKIPLTDLLAVLYMKDSEINANTLEKFKNEFALKEEELKELFQINNELLTSFKYFILRTGSGQYEDEEGVRYHFKKGIPGSTQLRNAENKAKFIYLENNEFYGSGTIGKISSLSDEEEYYAEIKNYERFSKPIRLRAVSESLSDNIVTRAGINQISEEDFFIILQHKNASFKFEEKDFKSCTGTEKDAVYIWKRFKEFRDALQDFSSKQIENYDWWVPRANIRGSSDYRPNMWVGIADSKYLKEHGYASANRGLPQPRRGVQLQVSINKSDPFTIEIFIDKFADIEAKDETKINIENNKRTFLKLINQLEGYVIGHSASNEWDTKTFSVADLNDFLEDFNGYTYVSKTLSKDEVLEMGPNIIKETVDTWKIFLPIYNIIIKGTPKTKAVIPLDKVSITHLIIGRNIVFYGPPGTGKTRKAKNLAELFCGENGYSLQTGNAEWTVFDVVGGPTLNSRFKPGFFSEAVRRCVEKNKEGNSPYWIILDEINRANLDLGFGTVFTLLDLDYRESRDLIEEIEVEGLKNSKDWKQKKIPIDFRILSTMNTYDRAILFSLGFAFRRRFAFVEVPAPFQNIQGIQRKVNDDMWKEEIQKIDGKFEIEKASIRQEIKEWIIKRNILTLPEALGEAISLDGNLIDRLKTVNEEMLNKSFDPFDVYAISVRLADYVTGNAIIEVGYAQPVDLIKFSLVYLSLFQDENPIESIVTAMDEAVKAYFIPQMEYFLPKVRREMTIGDEQGLKESAKLDELIAYLRNLGFEKSTLKLESAKDRLRYGEIRIL